MALQIAYPTHAHFSARQLSMDRSFSHSRSVSQSVRFRQNNRKKWGWLFALSCCTALSCNSKVPNNELDLINPAQPTVSSPSAEKSIDLEERLRGIVNRNCNLRPLRQSENAAWQVFHGAVPYGTDLLLEVEGQPTPALEYLFQGGELPGWNPRLGEQLESTGRYGMRLPVEEGSYTGQGHVDQFLGYISQANVPLQTPITVGGHEITLEDWARQAQRDIGSNPYREYSWTLIALTNYFPNETQWVGSDGKTWSLESFVKFEAEQDLSRSACGGMHRLMGLAHAVRFRQNQGLRFEGGWQLAKQVVDDSIARARSFQNSDGTFSTRYTVRPANSSDLGTCIGATGHTLEFLAYAVPRPELSSAWLEKAVVKLCQMIESTESFDLECGAGYHALAGLNVYLQRRYGNE